MSVELHTSSPEMTSCYHLPLRRDDPLIVNFYYPLLGLSYSTARVVRLFEVFQSGTLIFDY